jgi:endoglucanase
MYAQKWIGNILGANTWGSSFIVGDGTIFPNCIQHQAVNLAGALDGTSGGTPILWGASPEGPAIHTSSGIVGGMIACPADGVDTFAKFNSNDPPYNANQYTYYRATCSLTPQPSRPYSTRTAKNRRTTSADR